LHSLCGSTNPCPGGWHGLSSPAAWFFLIKLIGTQQALHGQLLSLMQAASFSSINSSAARTNLQQQSEPLLLYVYLHVHDVVLCVLQRVLEGLV